MLGIAGLGLVSPPLLTAQGCNPAQGGCTAGTAAPPQAAPGWDGHARVLGINAAVGGLTAGIRNRARGGSFWRGMVGGAAGGATIHAGKWLSAEPVWGAGVAGRQVAAVGSAVVRNVSEGRSAFDHLLLPLGPVRVYVDRGAVARTQVKLDLLGSLVLSHQALSSDSRFDAAASLSAGTAVFHTHVVPRSDWHGSNTAGVILLRDRNGFVTHGGEADPGAPSRVTADLVFAHERIHLLQYDQAVHTWSAPAEKWLLRRLPGGAWLNRYFDVGLITVPVMLLNAAIEYDDRPWEREAHFFAGPY